MAGDPGLKKMESTNWLITEWNASVADVMLAMADAKPQMEFSPIERLPQEECLWWKQPFSCAHDSPMWIGAPEVSWRAIGQSVLSSAGVESPPAAESRSTYLEILGQSISSLARQISSRLSTEVTCDDGIESPLESTADRIFEVTARISDSQQVSFYLIVSEALDTALAIPIAPTTMAADQTIQPSILNSELANVASSRTFELLLDVELPISVSFGRTLLRVQEAINLVSGSLIELDRAVSDPVELLVNNCVIARGEVVVIEGNYGIRLTEIVSHKERLQQSRRYMLT